MGYFGRYDDKLRAQELRRNGFSYNQILQEIKVSKDTLSRWCRDIVLTEEQKQILVNNKISGQRKGSLIAAENKRKARLEKTEKIFLESKKEIGKIGKRDRFIAGISLYLGEGDKADGRAVFTNSDPRLIVFMKGWFKEFCNIPESKFRGAIWLHEGLDEKAAKDYWSKLTGIPMNQFHKTYIAKDKKDSQKIRKNIHPYGVLAIRFSDTDKHRKIMGWISGLLDDRISNVR